MAHNQFSISTGDLSMSPVSRNSPVSFSSSSTCLLKHPAFIRTPPSLRRRTNAAGLSIRSCNSIAFPIRHSHIPLVKTISFYDENGDGNSHRNQSNKRRAYSLRETSKSLMHIDRPSSSSTNNSSEPESPLDSSKPMYWSASLLHYYTKSGTSPRFSSSGSGRKNNKHLQCQLPSNNNISMDHPKKYLSKSPSIDSGNASGSMRRRKPPASLSSSSPGRKRHSSISSASTTSSSSLGSFKEKLEKTEPVEVIKKKSSLASLISRKSSVKQTVKKQQIHEDESTTADNTISGAFPPPSPSPSKVSSSLRESLKAAKNLLTHHHSSTKISNITEISNPSSVNLTSSNANSPKLRDSSGSSKSHTLVEDSIQSSKSSSLTCLKGASSPIKTLAMSSSTSAHKGREENSSISSASVSSVYTSCLSPETKTAKSKNDFPTGSVSLPSTPGKKSKEKDGQTGDSSKSPSKRVSIGKLLSKKMRAAAGMATGRGSTSNTTDDDSTLNKVTTKVFHHKQSEDRKSPEIVNFEKEPRKLVPKPKLKPSRIVIVGKNNRGINEMEVSEEAVALAKKLREQQEQEEREENESRKKEQESHKVTKLEETDLDLNHSYTKASSEEQQNQEEIVVAPVALPRRDSSSTSTNNIKNGEIMSDSVVDNNFSSPQTTNLDVDDKVISENLRFKRDKELETDTHLYSKEEEEEAEKSVTDQERNIEEVATPSSFITASTSTCSPGHDEKLNDSSNYDTSEESPIKSYPQYSVPQPIPNSQFSSSSHHHHHHHHHHENADYNVVEEEEKKKRNNSSLSKHTAEFESGIGIESPTSRSSLDEQILRMYGSPDMGTDSNLNSASYHDVETEVDEEDTSMATTVTTTASEMDASFMLSRSLALTEDEFSYTESFKQLKPFQFDHVDPIPEGKRERLYKVLVVGELGTGKTSIIKRYVHQFFSQHYRATIGVDFALKVLRWDPETVVRLQLWDIAGQERFGSMTRVYYKEAVGAFVVFDVTRSATLEAVPKWKADLDSKVVLPDGRPIPTVLLANKSDQPKEGIAANREKMNEFCQQQGFSAWFETSAKDNINIDESANFLVSKILDMDKWSQEPMSDPEKLELGANGKHKGPGGSNCAC